VNRLSLSVCDIRGLVRRSSGLQPLVDGLFESLDVRLASLTSSSKAFICFLLFLVVVVVVEFMTVVQVPHPLLWIMMNRRPKFKSCNRNGGQV
jgi:hypothetical protein